MTVPKSRHALRIFVSVGTHEQGFPRLLSAVMEIMPSQPEATRWRIQTGPAKVEYPSAVQARPAYSHEEMLANLAWADVMVSQASPGNVFTALESLAQPVVLARRHELAEHVDDHQVVFAQYLQSYELAMVATDADSLAAHLERLCTEPPDARRQRLGTLCLSSRERTGRWVSKFDDAIQRLIADDHER